MKQALQALRLGRSSVPSWQETERENPALEADASRKAEAQVKWSRFLKSLDCVAHPDHL